MRVAYYSTSCVVVCIALGVDVFRGGPCPPLYIRGDRVTWKVLAEYSWSPTTTQSGSFFCTAASPTHIRVVTREVRYIHELSLTLEYSMFVSSPVAPGLTGGDDGAVLPAGGTIVMYRILLYGLH